MSPDEEENIAVSVMRQLGLKVEFKYFLPPDKAQIQLGDSMEPPAGCTNEECISSNYVVDKIEKEVMHLLCLRCGSEKELALKDIRAMNWRFLQRWEVV